MNKIILLAIAAISGLFLFASVCETIELRASGRWLDVEGVIKDAKLFESQTDSDSGGHTSYWIDLEYQFQVDGAIYRNQEAIGLESSFVPERYKEGATLKVFYNPSDPNRSYLVHRGYSSPIIMAIMGGVLLLVSSPFLFYHGLLFYADFQIRKAKRLMQEGFESVKEIQNETAQILAANGELPDGWQEGQAELAEKASEAYELMREVESQRKSFD